VNPLPATAALLALAAAFVGVPRRAMAPSPVGRVLAVLAALVTVPTLEEAAAWPAAALVTGAAVFATPLPCLFGAAAAALSALAAPVPVSHVPFAPILAALSLAAITASVDTETGARLRSGLDSGWPSVIGGLGLCLALALSGDGQVLGWRVALRSSEKLVTLPGAGLVAGLTLLVTLAGSLGLAAHLLTPAVPSGLVRRFAGRLLVLGGGLAILSAGYVLYRGASFPEMLPAAAPGWAAVLLGTGALVASLAILIGDPVRAEPQPWLGRASLEARIGAGLAVAAAAAAGVESWLGAATYATPATAAAASAALLALAVVEATKWSLLRKGLLIVALVFVLIGA